MFMYASMIGLSDVLKRTPVVDKNPIFPLLKIFQLNVTEVINHSWTGVGETCCCCYTPMEYSHMDPTKDYRINGYLQSFKYFSNFTERIRTQDFRFKENLRESVGRKQLELFNSYCPDYNRTKSSQNCTLIGVHVRRGDITSLNMQDYGFVVANRAYLLRAFDYFRQKLPDKQLIFTVIGNDYGWNLENLKNISETHMTVAILPTSASEFDLALLSSSDHFIMTTGTYGWWAGFLTGGIVVYHKVFARPGSYLASQMVGEDHFPPEWVPL